MVSILKITPSWQSNIINIGSSPEFREKSYSKQIMILALNKLKELRIEKVGLRVHVKNNRAKGLYNSLGFKTTDQQIDMIHWED